MLDLTRAFATFPALETARFQLREVQPDDAARIFEIMSDPRVTRYFGMLPMENLAAAERRIAGIREAFAERSGVRWAIAERAGGRLLGTCGFWRLVAEHDRAEIGYELAAESWGQGVMTEALGAMLTFGFAEMGLHSVEAQIHPANIGSRRVLEKLGFAQEGYFRENYHDVVEGGYTDTAVFSLLARDWRERR
jgi:ribosomal-protein-alanine N-acetyltransferase